MSRSRKKTPAGGVTSASSDKWFKVAAHRSERRAAKVCMGEGRQPEHPKAFGNPWGGPKDGKTYWHRAVDKDLRK